MSIGFNTARTREPFANCNHGAPLGKARTELKIFLKAIAQAVQVFCNLFPGMASQFLGARATLMPGVIPASIRTLTKGVPSLFCWRMVSSKRIAPPIDSPNPGVVTINSR